MTFVTVGALIDFSSTFFGMLLRVVGLAIPCFGDSGLRHFNLRFGGGWSLRDHLLDGLVRGSVRGLFGLLLEVDILMNCHTVRSRLRRRRFGCGDQPCSWFWHGWDDLFFWWFGIVGFT